MSETLEAVKSPFASDGTYCAGDLYLPQGVEKPPVVVMAHGFAALKSFGLASYARRFADRGLAVFAFDYRSFGESEGEPRHIVDPIRHLEDWRNALTHVRSLAGVDTSKIVLWGTSFSGGHVLQIASEDPNIAATISQVPHVDGMATLAMAPPRNIVLGSLAALRDGLHALTGQAPYYLPVVGHPGDLAAMTQPESYDGYMKIVPLGSPWQNRVAARVMFQMPSYSPGRHAERITGPVLLIVGKHDSLVPNAAVRKVAAKIPQGELVELDCNHFQPYNEYFEQGIAAQLTFLEKLGLVA